MARKAAIKHVEEVVTQLEELEEEIVVIEEPSVEEEKIVKETPLVIKISVMDVLKLDDNNEIIIEKSSDYWIYAYWSDKKMKALLFSFEINHSTTVADIVKNVKKFARDRFAYLAEKTFVA